MPALSELRLLAQARFDSQLLDHLLATAGNASLMTVPLRQTPCEHAAGNHRILMNLAGELLAQAAQRELP